MYTFGERAITVTMITARKTGNWMALLRPHLRLTERCQMKGLDRQCVVQVTYDSAAGPNKNEPASKPVRKTVCTTGTM